MEHIVFQRRDTPRTNEITADGEPKFYARYVSLNELDEIEKEILSQIDRFKDIVDVMKVQRGALRKKQQQPPAPIPRD